MAGSRVNTGRRLAGVAVCVLGCTLPTDSGEQITASETGGGAVDTAVVAAGDTYIVGDFPNANYGTSDDLWVGNGPKRTLVRVDQAAIAAAVGTGTLVSAQLELTITVNPWGWGMARPVDVHRMTQSWTEGGATWNCAVDAVPGDPTPDCPEAGWEMGSQGPNPWAANPTATLMMTNGTTGVVPFDVTADVAAFLAEAAENHGWVVKSANEELTGRVVFGARESEVAPRLVLAVQPQDTTRPPVPHQLPQPSQVLTSVVGGEQYIRNLVDVRFDDSTSGATIHAFLAEFNATIVGGSPISGTYTLEIPDPGTEWLDYNSILVEMRAAPGVTWANEAVITAVIHARFTNDAATHGANRSAWFSTPNNYTRSRLAVRAPLAWGCENGLYGGAGARVAIAMIDFLFADHDLDSSSISRTPLPPQTLSVDTRHGNSTVARNHGTGLVSILAATGDDGDGLAGMIWGADLHLYQFSELDSTGVLRSIHPVSVFNFALFDATLNGARIVASAQSLVLAHDTLGNLRSGMIQEAESTLVMYLRASTENLYIQSLPNHQGQSLTIAQVDSGMAPVDSLTVLDVALARVRTQFPNQVINVVATDNQGALAGFSALWTDGTDVAAPGVDVLMLSYAGGDTTASGNSFAVPFVGGVAAQLRAMDSTLTGAEVKDYILRGAQQARFNPNTGQFDSAQAIQGAPGVYQLDAYGALSLLSRERDDVPICGYPVWGEGTNIMLGRTPGAAPTAVPVSGVTQIANVSVAQGGRLIAASTFESDTGQTGTRVWSHLGGNAVATLPDVFARQYLERDTADIVRIASDTLLLTMRRGDGTPPSPPIDLFRQAQPSEPFIRPGELVVSPIGDWAAIRYGVIRGGIDPPDTEFRWDLVPIAGGNAVRVFELLREDPDVECLVDCHMDGDGALNGVAWSHDNRRVVFTIPLADLASSAGGGEIELRAWEGTGVTANSRVFNPGQEVLAVRTYVRSIPFVNGMPQSGDSIPIEGWWLFNPRFAADDLVLAADEIDGPDINAATCRMAWRAVANLSATIDVGSVFAPAHCDPTEVGGDIANDPVIFNSRAHTFRSGQRSGNRSR